MHANRFTIDRYVLQFRFVYTRLSLLVLVIRFCILGNYDICQCYLLVPRHLVPSPSEDYSVKRWLASKRSQHVSFIKGFDEHPVEEWGDPHILHVEVPFCSVHLLFNFCIHYFCHEVYLINCTWESKKRHYHIPKWMFFMGANGRMLLHYHGQMC